MLFKNRRLSVRQMQTIIILWIFASSIVGVPSVAIQNAAGVAMGALIVVIEGTIVIFTEHRVKESELLYRIITIVAGVSTAIYSGINLRIMAGAVNLFLLQKTPMIILGIVFAVGCMYMAILGIQTVGRTGELLFVIVALNAIIAIILCLIKAERKLLSAVTFYIDKETVYYGVKHAFMFGGMQILYLLIPYTEGKDKVKKIYYTIIISISVVIFFTLIAIAKFGMNDMLSRVFPALNIMDTISLDFVFGDKQDAFMLRMWVFSTFIAVGMGIFFGGQAFTPRRSKSNIGIIPGFLICIDVSLTPKNTNSAIDMLYYLGLYSFIIFIIVFPLISLFIKEKRGDEI